jgi:hypothetical protein
MADAIRRHVHSNTLKSKTAAGMPWVAWMRSFAVMQLQDDPGMGGS